MIFLMGETAAAREISESLQGQGIEVLRVLPKDQSAFLSSINGEIKGQGRMGDIPGWAEKFACAVFIDACHPSLSSSLGQLRLWCERQGIPYMRLERPATKVPDNPLIHAVDSWEKAVERLEQSVNRLAENGKRPTVFVTTGSHQLEALTRSALARRARLVVRVLPEGRLVQKCQDLGIPPRDIVAMQGTFSREINRSLFKFYGADILLTRDSGLAGGTDTKIAAALALNMEVILIKRNGASNGLAIHSVADLLAQLPRHLNSCS